MSGPQSNRPPSGDAAETSDAGVLGRLPRSRPAVRSPRRDAAPARPAQAEAERPTAAESVDQGTPADLEALARAGLDAAGSAASLGVRIATRAATALRDAVERR